jgi:hypothetical protein
MPNCKPGDLAVVVRASDPGSPNLGRMVHVIGHARTDSHTDQFGVLWKALTPDDGLLWLCRAVDGQPLMSFNAQGVVKPCGPERPFRDAFLQPIRPPAQPTNREVSADKHVNQPKELA